MTAERKAKLKEIWMDLLFDIIGGILYAAGIYSFASQAEFAPGGISGLAIIINHFTQWPIGICTLVLNIPIVIICIRTLGKKFFFKSIKTMVISTVIIDFVFPLLPVYKGDALMAALFAGALSGAGLALVAEGPLGMAAGAAIGIVAALLGKPAVESLLMRVNLPTLMRKMLPKNALLSPRSRGKMEKAMAASLEKDEAFAASIVKDVAEELDAFIERLAAKTEIRLN